MRKSAVFFAFLFLLQPITGSFSYATASNPDKPAIASPDKKKHVLAVFKAVAAMDTLPSATTLQQVLDASWLPSEMTDEKRYVPEKANSLWASVTRNSCGVINLAINPAVAQINEADVRKHFAGRTLEEVQQAEGGMGSTPVTKTMFAKLPHCDAHFEFNSEGDQVRSVLFCWRSSSSKPN